MTPLTPRERWARAGLTVTALTVAASLVYPIFAVGPRLAQRFPERPSVGTLNALAWMDMATLSTGAGRAMSFAGDRAAIDWLNSNVVGSPVVAEASIGPYRGNGSRISIGTGLPTIIGWERHQQQQRYPDELSARVEDVRRLYDSLDPVEKWSLIQQYQVGYVVVGDVERLWVDNLGRPYATEAGLAAFSDLVGTRLVVAFTSGGTTIYRVIADDPA